MTSKVGRLASFKPQHAQQKCIYILKKKVNYKRAERSSYLNSLSWHVVLMDCLGAAGESLCRICCLYRSLQLSTAVWYEGTRRLQRTDSAVQVVKYLLPTLCFAMLDCLNQTELFEQRWFKDLIAIARQLPQALDTDQRKPGHHKQTSKKGTKKRQEKRGQTIYFHALQKIRQGFDFSSFHFIIINILVLRIKERSSTHVGVRNHELRMGDYFSITGLFDKHINQWEKFCLFLSNFY